LKIVSISSESLKVKNVPHVPHSFVKKYNMKKLKKYISRNDILKVLGHFKEINAERYNIVRLGLFGSGVHDRCEEESDVDIVVVLAKPDLFNLIGIKQDLEEAFQRHVDIVRYREKMNPFLKKRIDKEALYV